MVENEDKHVTNISWTVYWKLLSLSVAWILFELWSVADGCPSLCTARLSSAIIVSWTSLPLSQQLNQNSKNLFLFISLTVLGIQGVFASLIGAVFLYLSNSLHNSMLNRVAYASMLFFNSNPLGRIINRFSKDTALSDNVVTAQAFLWF